MTSITVYDGTNTIGGSKIYLEEKGEGLFLDFGMNFKKYEHFYKNFLSWRSSRGIYDLIQLNLIPKLNIYREDLIPSDLDTSSFPSLNINAVLLSHAHLDHFGNIGLLKPEYPIVASPTTIMLLKGILDSSFTVLGSEVAYYSLRRPIERKGIIESVRSKEGKDIGRNFISTADFSDSLTDFLSTSVKSRKDLESRNVTHLQDFSSDFEIKAFEIDHSIFGATAFYIEGDTTIAYTGDFRLHGKRGIKSENFFKQAKTASVLIIEGTRAAREDVNESEDLVYENCLKAVQESEGLVVADFTSRNFERLETFQKVAKNVDRSLIVTSKDAYLLNAIEKADGVNRTKDLLIFDELRASKRNWEDIYLKSDIDINYIDPTTISKDPNKYLLCFSLYDVKHLLDINPEKGSFVYSSSEAFQEESEFDFVRLHNWLKHFGFQIHGFDIIKEGDQVKPVFTKGYHASGHAGIKDLRWAIETIDPDVIIPVHTENPEWFRDNFEKTRLLQDNEMFTI